MNIKDLRKKTIGELDKELAEKVSALSNFKFGTSGSKVIKMLKQEEILEKKSLKFLQY
jgi:cobalamin biosynthesis Co2+ chelatase CbiK